MYVDVDVCTHKLRVTNRSIKPGLETRALLAPRLSTDAVSESLYKHAVSRAALLSSIKPEVHKLALWNVTADVASWPGSEDGSVKLTPCSASAFDVGFVLRRTCLQRTGAVVSWTLGRLNYRAVLRFGCWF